MSLATVTHVQGDLDRAIELSEESMELYKKRGDKLALAWCLDNLGLVMYSLEDLAQAAKLTEDGVALLRELGAGSDTAVALSNLGWIMLLQNDLNGATDLFEEILSLAWESGMKPMVLPTLEVLACAAGARGDAQRAACLWGTLCSPWKQRASPGARTGSPSPTPASRRCARGWASKRGRRRRGAGG